MPQVRPFVMDGWRRSSIPSLNHAGGDEIEASVQGERRGLRPNPASAQLELLPACVIHPLMRRPAITPPSVLQPNSLSKTIQG